MGWRDVLRVSGDVTSGDVTSGEVGGDADNDRGLEEFPLTRPLATFVEKSPLRALTADEGLVVVVEDRDRPPREMKDESSVLVYD